MEYADGGDLRKYLKENFPKLTWEEAKIIDLSIAKSTKTETYIHSGVLGVVAYIDPYKYNDKSDIYSLGVLI
ncbi:hypothetical protein C1646_766182 [Rhizophagus diaphanus]|nr:hypothetical protein C1646_766182 [Rhizophagus diaphanus] [Rhizophagus sp. MUCL 43196]